ncbi:MAG: lamin tail domain-containing protein [Deltaproteobacteria bacterium]|nr:lamin tail domain-containing protein [Deltaproteobacteria bacterium]
MKLTQHTLAICSTVLFAACVESVDPRPDRREDARQEATADAMDRDQEPPPNDVVNDTQGTEAGNPSDSSGIDASEDTAVMPPMDVMAPPVDGVTPPMDVVMPPMDSGGGTCSGGLTSCGGSCVDLQSDPRFCGSCMRACGATQVCAAGSCQSRVSALVLSELRAQSTPYIELYNGGNAAVDLAGYIVQWSLDAGASGSVTLPAFSLPGGEFVVLTTGTGSPPSNTLFLPGLPAWTQRIAVRLLTPAGVGQDFVRTSDSTVAPPAGTAWMGVGAANPAADINQSLVRNVFTMDTDSAADWSLQSLSSPTSYCALRGVCGARCVELDNDIRNCGACGVSCGATQVCRGGACAPAAGNLWISEYRRSPRPMVELHNPTSRAINIRNYRLQAASGGTTRINFFLPDVLVESGAYLAIYEGTGTNSQSAIYTAMTGVLLANSSITLFDTGTTALDFVPFGSGATTAPMGTSWFGSAVTDPESFANVSARRNIAGLDTDSAADWVVNRSPATPGFACVSGLSVCAANCVDTNVDPAHCGGCDRACSASATCIRGTCRASERVLLSRIKNQGVEEIEVHNGSNTAVDLSGWVVSWVTDMGSGDYTVPMGTMLMPNQYAVFAEGTGIASGGRFPVGRTIDWTNFAAISLRDAMGTGRDFVRTSTSPTMPPAGTLWTAPNATNPSDTVNESLVRNVWTADTDSAADWRLVAAVVGPGLCTSTPVCGGVCVNTTTDLANCGACGNACPVGNRCIMGRCFEGNPPLMSGDLRLVNGSGGNSGILEIYNGSSWGGVCDDSNLDANFIRVACRRLGFAGTGTATCCQSSAAAPFSLDDVLCNGSESSLLSCAYRMPFGSHNCSNGEYIRLVCN